MDAGEPAEIQNRALLARFRNLEASQAEIEEQLNELKEKMMWDGGSLDSRKAASDPGRTNIPGCFSEMGPYCSVLKCMGHAVHVCVASSGEIVYWNISAEKLYGWKAFEALGQRVADLLIDEQHFTSMKKILEKLNSGHSWSGQFPFKKRSGDIFMAIVTKSPLNEDGELVGIITVSSDAATFNSMCSEKLRQCHDRDNDQRRVRGLNMKKIQWHPQPQIASSVSYLASKVLFRRREDNACAISSDSEETGLDRDEKSKKPEMAANPTSELYMGKSLVGGKSSCKEESAFEFAKLSKIAAKVLEKLNIRGVGDHANEKGRSVKQNDSKESLVSNEVKNEPNFQRCLEASTSHQCNVEAGNKRGYLDRRNSSFADKGDYLIRNGNRNSATPGENRSPIVSSLECHECFGVSGTGKSLPKLGFQVDAMESKQELQNLKLLEMEDAVEQQPDVKQCHSSGESIVSSQESSSPKTDNESNTMADYEIKWEDLHLKEEIGQGSYAVVYRGIWNGSDVAVKIYVGNEYNDGTLLDYKKEIDIMRRLRHPNVLLFMGAVCSQERLAIVTEFLPRGSLFRTLHKNNQVLDIRRRLRMAIDVARGMNYLHHRNPPIVHRDLKSSNLLVDKTWTVKVGDFGLSRLKNTTFITAKSGRGTPQWMAPEVLRNDPSNEKSDVFSFGVILWELMTESIPWCNLNSLQVVGVVGFMDRRLDIPEGLDPRVSTVIQDCWQSDPERRPSFEDIIERMTAQIRTVPTMPMPQSSEPQ